LPLNHLITSKSVSAYALSVYGLYFDDLLRLIMSEMSRKYCFYKPVILRCKESTGETTTVKKRPRNKLKRKTEKIKTGKIQELLFK
jgi:hypothetical protein